MIPRGVEVFVGLEPIDLRWSFDRLSGIANERVGRDARSGALFVFFGKRRRRTPFSIPIEQRHNSVSVAPVAWKACGAGRENCPRRDRCRPSGGPRWTRARDPRVDVRRDVLLDAIEGRGPGLGRGTSRAPSRPVHR
jgi:hypothetical protein